MLDRFPVTRRWPPQHPDRIQLYSLNTPNGVKVSILLEETGLPYEAHLVDLSRGDQRESRRAAQQHPVLKRERRRLRGERRRQQREHGGEESDSGHRDAPIRSRLNGSRQPSSFALRRVSAKVSRRIFSNATRWSYPRSSG